MSLIFQIEAKPKYKSIVVFGVEIPLYGDITVAETIAIEKALMTEVDAIAVSNTEYAKTQVSAWLSTRLGADKAEINEQLNQSKALIDKLWEVYYGERESHTTEYEVIEGKEENSEPLKTSKKNGTAST